MRLFIAINLSENQKQELYRLQQGLQQYLKGVRWVSPAGMHITLKFLGEVRPALRAEIIAAMGRAAAASAGFSFKFKGLGVFPGPTRARVIWAGLAEGAPEMGALFDRLEKALIPLGFPGERRPFTPHLTLGRVRNPLPRELIARALTGEKDFISSPKNVERILLYRSHLSRQGAKYELLAEEFLPGGAGKE